MLQLEKELVQARLSEAESHCALKEMQDKVLEMEKVNQTRTLYTEQHSKQTTGPCNSWQNCALEPLFYASVIARCFSNLKVQ